MSDSFLISVIRVADFHTSLTFYRDKLGFRVDWMDPDIQTAQLTGTGQELLVLTANPELDVRSLYPADQVVDGELEESATDPTSGADSKEPVPAEPGSVSETEESAETGPAAEGEKAVDPVNVEAPAEQTDQQGTPGEEWTGDPLVEEVEESSPAARWHFREVEPEGTLSFYGENLVLFQEHLSVLAVPDLLLEESPGVEQVLTFKDPDGYRIAFHESLRLSDEELLELYRKGPDLLEGAILGLTEEDLDLPVEEGVTIRQLVLQMVDFDLEMMQRMKWALAESGRSYPIPLYDTEEWAEALAYDRRPTHVELSMYRLLRDHILTMCESVEGALDRHLVSEQGIVEVRTMMQVVAETSREQIQSILDTRHQYDK
ncbi:hypothetical protein [Desmospora profundinema]|uniref:Catechol 2,3-dioxygenase-like lactoylglutathione lyase family enzyme n=1 Tax=Desmospora profundinema TaxID=1571184 RepID=A0ABU1IMY8_9BACL|nr:hypothetical protein [Desmospora profundinema]MDR6226136.1 catechol 2,3-dioxygenase-like lactoylglutathione lyase family enzyme [Desmospora profundinema]